MVRRAKRRRAGGPSYEEVKAQINAREEEKRLEKLRSSSNRILPILSELNSTRDQEDQMLMIMDALKETVTPVPEEGGLYTFIYNAKTPRIEYDQHPLIVCTQLDRWGFRGLNFHWRRYRNYTWNEIAGLLYEVKLEELDDLLSVQYGKFLINR
jgi:hypothetical protein